MKIVHIINSLETGGAETLVVNLVLAAKEAGDECEIVTLRPAGGVPLRRAEKHGIKVTAIASSLWDPRIPIRLRSLTRDADVVHVHLFPALYWAAAIAKPLLFTEHSTSNRRMENPAFRVAERLVYARYSGFFAISEGVASSLSHYLEFLGLSKPVVTAPNGISSDFLTENGARAAGQRRIAFVGSLKEVKRADLAIRAVARLKDARLQIAGDGPLAAPLAELSHDLGVASRVEFLGEVDDVRSVLLQNDVLLSTSEFEGFSLVAAEAQATGVPVVGPDVAGFNEVVLDGETGVLFSDRTPEGIASAVNEVLALEAYPRFSANAKAHARRFSIEASYLIQRKHYADLIHESKKA